MEALDFRYILLEYYKKLNISETELAVILMIDHLIEQKNTLITPDLLSIKMNLSTTDLDKILVELINKGILLFEVGKKIKVSLKPLQKKLYVIFEEELAKENAINADEEKSKALVKLQDEFKKLINRQLSPLELTLIKDWFEHGFRPETIIDALRECIAKGDTTLKAIDKLLYQWQTRDDIEKAGFSSTSDKWDKDIEKTIEIARAKWIDD